MRLVFNRGNAYFDTYYIYNDKWSKIGIIEHHCRGVKNEYFVGWKLNNNSLDTGTTQDFDTKEDAIFYSIGHLNI